MWSDVTSALKQFGIDCVLDLIEGKRKGGERGGEKGGRERGEKGGGGRRGGREGGGSIFEKCGMTLLLLWNNLG